MVSLEQDFLFKFSAFHLVVVNDHILSERLHGIDLFGAFLLNEEDLAKAASSNDLPDDEVLQSHSFVSLLGKDCLRRLSKSLANDLAVDRVI